MKETTAKYMTIIIGFVFVLWWFKSMILFAVITPTMTYKYKEQTDTCPTFEKYNATTIHDMLDGVVNNVTSNTKVNCLETTPPLVCDGIVVFIKYKVKLETTPGLLITKWITGCS